MVRAVVFDFDGLILDTEGPVFTAWQEAFAAHGCPPLTIEEWATEIGTAGALDMVALLQARATAPVDVDAMHERRRARRDELLGVEVVQAGVHQWLEEASELGLRVAIASSSPHEWVYAHLERLQLPRSLCLDRVLFQRHRRQARARHVPGGLRRTRRRAL